MEEEEGEEGNRQNGRTNGEEFNSDRPHKQTKAASKAHPAKRRPRQHLESEKRHPHRSAIGEKRKSNSSSQRSSNVLSIDSLAKLDALNEKTEVATKRVREKDKWREKERKRERERESERERRVAKDRYRKEKDRRRLERRESETKRRVVSGPLAEEGMVVGKRGGGYISGEEEHEDEERRRKRKNLWLTIISLLLLLAILIPVGVVTSKKKKSRGPGGAGGGAEDGQDPKNTNLAGISQNDIPTSAKGGVLDPFSWYDTTNFNVTFTDETVGGLPIMGLNSTWNDAAQANQNVPPLNKPWAYGTMPIRGINLGGWLSLEPFITPSLFTPYKADQGVIDEYTLSTLLGPNKAAKVLEKHYALFMTERTFRDVQDAGFDHVRIPFSYWAVTTYPGDPYVPKISWRYLLRGIEYARKYGLRVNLDVHALPGSQNGWNHSGRQGAIGWLNGTDGDTNAQRSLDLHRQLATFFAQPRYKNVIAIYGLVNEPRMSALPVDSVIAWTTNAVQVVRKNGIKQLIAFGDGFLGLDKWKGKLQGIDGLVLDAHQYTIFNPDQIAFTHAKKIDYACKDWSAQMQASLNTATG